MLSSFYALSLCCLAASAQTLSSGARTAHLQNKADARASRVFSMSTEHRLPQVLVFSCSDSRVDPEQIFGLQAGDVYSYRVPGNIVAQTQVGASYKEPDSVSHILRSALDNMKVDVIVVLGHSECSTIEPLTDPQAHPSAWALTAGPLSERIEGHYGALTPAQTALVTVAENVRLQRERLLQRSDVQKALAAKTLKSVEAFVFELGANQRGVVTRWDDARGQFVLVAGSKTEISAPEKAASP